MKKHGSPSVNKRRRQAVVLPPVPFRFDNVTETAVRFNLPMKQITDFRSLAKQDPESDPWIGDFTLPSEFHKWLWGKRRELEKIQRQRNADRS